LIRRALLGLFLFAGALHAQTCVTQSQVTLTGNLRSANGLPSSNYIISMKPSQQGYIAGCGVNVASVFSCATSNDGSVVGIANPVVPTIDSYAAGGSLAPGTYYTVIAWVDASGNRTLPSPETTAQLNSTGTLVVNVPSTGVPAGATGMAVYVSTTSGTETLQGQAAAGNAYNVFGPLVTGASPLTANSTMCQVTANDSVWPTGTGYIVSLTDSDGNSIPGYPMQWQLLGAGTTINLSNGLPYYHGVVQYPVPILSAPANHGTQSISGGLNLEGYGLYDVGPFTSESLSTGEINGTFYPAACGGRYPPSWCSGTTGDAWYRAACAQLPSAGGTIDISGAAMTFAAQATCSTPTKLVHTKYDNVFPITVTETDGLTTFPQDNASDFTGPAGGIPGNCPDGGGIHLSSSANITAVVSNVHTDGTQESMNVGGLCITGNPTATVSQALVLLDRVYANSIVEGNVIGVCGTACAKALNTGEVDFVNNWFNVEDGVPSNTGIPLIIQGIGLGNGCNVGPVNVSNGQIEHALGGANDPEVLVEGDGSGLVLACDIHIHDLGIERSPAGAASVNGIDMRDCKNCSVENVVASGVSSGSQSMIKLTSNYPNSIANVTLRNISDIFASYTNTLNDTTSTSTIPGGILSYSLQPFITTYYANPGYVQPPVLPGTTIQAVGSDLLDGYGNFATGTSTLPTNFTQTGCIELTCVFTRTNSTAPTGYTYSEEIQITANSDTANGYNGVEYGPMVSFTAGQSYVANFWAKNDGTLVGYPSFLLWNPTIPTFACQNISSQAVTSTWTPYSFICTPSSSGTLYPAAALETIYPSTGTFWVAGFTFAPITSLTPGSFLTAVSPYGIGPASSGSLGNVTIGSGTGAPATACGTAPNGSGSLWLRTDGGSASTTLYVCQGTTWNAVTIP
jgi:hypothetical protein